MAGFSLCNTNVEAQYGSILIGSFSHFDCKSLSIPVLSLRTPNIVCLDVPYPFWAMPTKVIKESELLTKATDFICEI